MSSQLNAGPRRNGSGFRGRIVKILKSILKRKPKSTGGPNEIGVRDVVYADSPGSRKNHSDIDHASPNLAERPLTPPRSRNRADEHTKLSGTKGDDDGTGEDSGFFERDSDLSDEECSVARVLPELEYDTTHVSTCRLSPQVSSDPTWPQPQVTSRIGNPPPPRESISKSETNGSAPAEKNLFVQRRCLAITSKGTQCQAQAAIGYQYCERWHLIAFLRKNDPTFDDSAYCQAITAKGMKCTRRAASGEIYCRGEHLGKYGLRIKIEEPEWRGFESDGSETHGQVSHDQVGSPRNSETKLLRSSVETEEKQADNSTTYPITPPPVSCIVKPRNCLSPPSRLPEPEHSRPRRRSLTPCPDPQTLSSWPSVSPELRRKNVRQQMDGSKRCLGTTEGVVCANIIENDRTYCQDHKGQRLHCDDEEFWFQGRRDAAIPLNEWIPGYLSDETRRKLKEKMMQTFSSLDRDSHGLIYAYQLIDCKQTNQTHIKVGRTVSLTKRLENWHHQCGKDMKPLGFWPPREAQVGTATYRGARYHEVIESLVLLELNDIAVHSLHLLPGFVHDAEISQRPDYRKGKREPCDGPNCNGTVHCEIFSFERHENEEWRETEVPKEWESIVWPIIDKWGTFAKLYLEGRALK